MPTSPTSTAPPVPTLISYAKPQGPQCLQALPALQLPHLRELLRLLTPGARHSGEEDCLTPLHERLQWQAMGLDVSDGLAPWAALQARTLAPAVPHADTLHWAWLTPCHWQVNSDHVRMADPSESQIHADESEQVMQAMRGFLAEDGVALHGLHQGNWLASGAVFQDLPTASLAQASGGAVDHWLPRQSQAQTLRRLQNEMQMLLYSHPVNDGRAARGLLPINSFWVSGTGTLPPGFTPAAGLAVLDGLRASNLSDDPAAWQQAWQALDSGPIQTLLEQARQGKPVELMLCAETAAQSYQLQASSTWSRLRHSLLPGLGRVDLPALLQSL